MLTLAGLPTFCPITFHLFASYSLIASRSFTDCATSADVTTDINEMNVPRLQRTLRSACPAGVCQ